MAAPIENKFYSIDPTTQFYSVKLDHIETNEDADQVTSQLAYDARIEVLKSIAHYIIAAGATLLVSAVTIIAFKVSAFIIGLFTFPLAVIPPVYYMTTTFGALAVGGLVGYAVFKKYASGFVAQAKLHWNHAMHLRNQKAAVEAKQDGFLSNRLMKLFDRF